MANKPVVTIIMDERITKAANDVTEACTDLAKAAPAARELGGSMMAAAAVTAQIYRLAGLNKFLDAAAEQARQCDHKTAVLTAENDTYEVWQCEWECCKLFLVEKPA